MMAGVLLLSLALPLSIAGTNVALGILSIAALLRIGDARRWRAILHPVFYTLAAYCAVSALCAALGVDPTRGFRSWPKDFHKLWTTTLLLLAFSEEEPPPVLAAALGAGFAVSSVVAVSQVLFETTDWTGKWTRAHGFVHPVTFGCQVTLGLIGALCFLLRPPAALRSHRYLVAGLAALCVVALVLNQTRTAAVGLAAAAAAIGFAERRARRWTIVVLAAIAVTLVAWEIMPTGGRTLAALLATPQEGTVNPQRVRFVLWDIAWRIFKDHPGTGVGPGGYAVVFTRYFDGILDGERVWGSAHNLYLHQLAERGLAGLAVLLGLLGALFLSAWRAETRARSAWTLWSWAAVAGFAAMNLTETAFQTEQLATLFLLIWAAGAVPASRERRKVPRG